MKLSPDVVYRRVNDELLVLSLGESRYFQVNPTGTVIWELLGSDEGSTEAALVEAITDAFEVDTDTASADVDAFLSELRAIGALVE